MLRIWKLAVYVSKSPIGKRVDLLENDIKMAQNTSNSVSPVNYIQLIGYWPFIKVLALMAQDE
jgi:hypothetical protein